MYKLSNTRNKEAVKPILSTSEVSKNQIPLKISNLQNYRIQKMDIQFKEKASNRLKKNRL